MVELTAEVRGDVDVVCDVEVNVDWVERMADVDIVPDSGDDVDVVPDVEEDSDVVELTAEVRGGVDVVCDVEEDIG